MSKCVSKFQSLGRFKIDLDAEFIRVAQSGSVIMRADREGA